MYVPVFFAVPYGYRPPPPSPRLSQRAARAAHGVYRVEPTQVKGRRYLAAKYSRLYPCAACLGRVTRSISLSYPADWRHLGHMAAQPIPARGILGTRGRCSRFLISRTRRYRVLNLLVSVHLHQQTLPLHRRSHSESLLSRLCRYVRPRGGAIPLLGSSRLRGNV